jgi:hypothetical protein
MTLKKEGKRKNTKTQNGRRRKISRDRDKTTTNPFKDGRGERSKNFTGRSSCNETKPKKERSLPLSLSLSAKTPSRSRRRLNIQTQKTWHRRNGKTREETKNQ